VFTIKFLRRYSLLCSVYLWLYIQSLVEVVSVLVWRLLMILEYIYIVYIYMYICVCVFIYYTSIIKIMYFISPKITVN
jgi:hypothetical protein